MWLFTYFLYEFSTKCSLYISSRVDAQYAQKFRFYAKIDSVRLGRVDKGCFKMSYSRSSALSVLLNEQLERIH